MAEEVIIGSITTVAGAVADRAVTALVDNLSSQKPVADKLQRLERLLIRIRSTVEVSEKRDIKSAALLEWREKLRGAVALGDEVLLSFQQPAPVADTEAATDGSRRHQAMSFTRHALSSIGRRIRTAVAALFSSDADTKKLDDAVELLEEESDNILEFIALLQLELEGASSNLKRRRIPQIRSGRFGSTPYVLTSTNEIQLKMLSSLGHAYTPPIRGVLEEEARLVARLQIAPPPPNGGEFHEETARLVARLQIAPPPNGGEFHEETTRLVTRLHKALNQIGMAVTTVGGRDVSGLEWLLQWDKLLRDAKQQGRAVLGAIIGGGAKGSKETAGYDLEEDQLDSFVQTLESLAGDLGVFTELASFCPYN